MPRIWKLEFAAHSNYDPSRFCEHGTENSMRTPFTFCLPSVLVLLLGFILSVTPFIAQQSGRGTAPRGNTTPPQNSGEAGNRGSRGTNSDAAQARQQIQANRKAAIEQANAMYRLAMSTAQHDAKSEDAGARAQAQSEMQLAQSNRKSAIERANATAKAAIAALNSN